MGGDAGDSRLRALPSVDRVLRSSYLEPVLQLYRRELVTEVIRATLDSERRATPHSGLPLDADEVARAVQSGIRAEWEQAGPLRIINGTGVILHTNFGRAPLGHAALEAMHAAAAYSDLEYDLRTGTRGSRYGHAQRLLRVLTGAESAHVVVNNAAAMLLALTATARKKEVIVSRGQAVEIGGGFRVPVILQQSGARLVEVGTTNRTCLDDYRNVIGPRTAAILHVHPSNFRIEGFTGGVALQELAGLAHDHELLLIDDNGSGALLDTAQFGLAHEPMVSEAIEAGADLVAFSGDKLLGGPQSGIIVGRKHLVQRVAKHPLARVMRPDKMILAALSATLAAYLSLDIIHRVPVWRMIAMTESTLRQRVDKCASALAASKVQVELIAGESTVGGGALPGETLPTTLVRLPSALSASALRRASPAVLGRTMNGHVHLDLRTVDPDDDSILIAAIIDTLRTLPARSARAPSGESQ